MDDRQLDLRHWLADPPPAYGAHFATSDFNWERWSYPELAALARRFAAGLRRRGIGQGDVVLLAQRASPRFVAALFGSWAAGATASCVLAPGAVRPATYQEHLSHVYDTIDPVLWVADDEVSIPRTAPRTGGPTRSVSFDEVIADASADEEAFAAVPEFALLQFTSGSSGRPRGVRVSTRALGSNVAAMHEWLDVAPGTPAVSWLPVHHDMGLVGFTIGAIMGGVDLYLMQPEQFVRSPLRYLTALSQTEAKITGIPNFGLAYLLRRVRPAALAGLRFDALQGIIVGAERIDPDLLAGICALLTPHGLDPRALLPAYGAAEATLAITGLARDEPWQVRELPASVPDEPDPAQPGAGADRVVGCGRPLDGVTVRIVDDEGRELPEDAVGEIEVTGDALASGYVGAVAPDVHTRFTGTALRTGDAGFLADGQLYVLGRLGDAVKVRGRMVFAEHVEGALATQGIPRQRAVALLGQHGGVATAVVLLERAEPGWSTTASQVLRECASGAALLVVEAPGGAIAVTSSGKPRRRQMWREFCADRWSGAVLPVADSDR